MPYRRLPNTDKARIRSIKTAVDSMRNDVRYVPVIKPDLYDRANTLLKSFSAASDEYNTRLAKFYDHLRSDKYQTRLNTARTYVRDFLAVFSMSVNRGDFKRSDRRYYNLSDQDGDVPVLTGETQVLQWCENVIQGERARTSNGGIPIYNPTVAKLTVHYELFKEMYNQHKLLKEDADRALETVAGMREDVDSLILEMWNSIEAFFADKSGKAKLDACSRYGIIYYYRKGEERPD